ncbi:hypothetical protein AB0C77_12760 [Streptomyces sp. NPDC048629]|uniref:hypothetical protein n=1 Tax=Streptomyces sp. NPDC048629 TaxID=3154824 RepID=UPI0034480417
MRHHLIKKAALQALLLALGVSLGGSLYALLEDRPTPWAFALALGAFLGLVWFFTRFALINQRHQ